MLYNNVVLNKEFRRILDGFAMKGPKKAEKGSNFKICEWLNRPWNSANNWEEFRTTVHTFQTPVSGKDTES